MDHQIAQEIRLRETTKIRPDDLASESREIVLYCACKRVLVAFYAKVFPHPVGSIRHKQDAIEETAVDMCPQSPVFC